jgi:hypothetical protein
MQIVQLRELCALYWNPIGVPMANVATQEQLGFRPMPEDEYDTYLLHVDALMREGATRDQIADYLSKVERDYLMLPRVAGNKAAFIEALFQSWSDSENGNGDTAR